MTVLARKCLVCLWAVCLVIAFGNYVAGATLSFDPSTSTIGIGDQIGIDINVSGLEDVDLGAFDLNLNYEDTLLSFESYVLGDVLGDIPGDADDWSLGDLGGGVINLAELSYLDYFSSQPDAFFLATVFFTGSAMGTSSLFFSDVDLGDQLGDPITGPSLETGSLTVVPVPAVLWLLGSGLIGLVGFRRKVRN